MADKTNNGIGIGGILFVVFLILKLCGTIDWSWWWVTAPLWIPFGVKVILILLCFLISPKGTKRGILEGLGVNKHDDGPKTMKFDELCDELGIDKSAIDKMCGE
jgi:hypothetical protein